MSSRRVARLTGIVLAIAGTLALVSPAGARDRGLEKRLRNHIEILAGDDFAGREPGTEGEAKTLRYLGRQWFDIGLVSGTNDPGNEWFAPVMLVAREPAASTAQFRRRGRPLAVPESETLVLTSGKRALVRDAPLLFVGMGEDMDFARAELAGRIAVMLAGEDEGGERQTALLRAGASGVMTILDGNRTLGQIAARRRRSGYALSDESLGGDLEAFITREGMAQLLEATGHSLNRLDHAAHSQDFAPLALEISTSLEATTRETTIKTFNLIGKLPGRKPETGAVLLVSHWDHFGVCAEPPAEDIVCNGAIDNASGVAALTEIARRVERGPKLDRDVYFLATTAEELGLLGAMAFAEKPPLPLSSIVAAFNIDSVAIAPAGSPLGMVGAGMTGLDDEIARVARRARRRLVINAEANDYLRRQDGWALLQHDIPAVMVSTAYGDIHRMRRFFDSHYHRPSDDLDHTLELGGAADDVAFHVDLVRWFADASRYSPPLRETP